MEVSVIIPVYNVERFIRKAVASCVILSEVKEIILVEDNSQDSSLKICYELSISDKRIKVIQHHDKRNHGRGASRNLGIKNATSEYISFLDADDFYLPNRFEETQKTFLSHPDADGIYEAIGVYAYDIWAGEKHEKRMKRQNGDPEFTRMDNGIPPEKLFDEMLIGRKGWFHFNGLTLKKTAFNKSGLLNGSFRYHEDDDFFYRLGYFCKLYSGSNIPVAIRGVYMGNATLDDAQEPDRLNEMPHFVTSLLSLMLNNPMSKKSAWIITLKYLSYIDVNFSKLPYGRKRKILMLWNLLKLILKKPKIITKLIFEKKL